LAKKIAVGFFQFVFYFSIGYMFYFIYTKLSGNPEVEVTVTGTGAGTGTGTDTGTTVAESFSKFSKRMNVNQVQKNLKQPNQVFENFKNKSGNNY
jgi:hypothetical protein